MRASSERATEGDRLCGHRSRYRHRRENGEHHVSHDRWKGDGITQPDTWYTGRRIAHTYLSVLTVGSVAGVTHCGVSPDAVGMRCCAHDTVHHFWTEGSSDIKEKKCRTCKDYIIYRLRKLRTFRLLSFLHFILLTSESTHIRSSHGINGHRKF